MPNIARRERVREGVRDRKKRETQERIAAAGLALFLERGFEETTLDAIADRADIARRTFFHYFESKEAILATIETGAEAKLSESLEAMPPDRPPLEAACEAVRTLVAAYASDEARAIDRLLRSTEPLRARKQANYVRLEAVLYAGLKARSPADPSQMKLRIAAMMAIGLLRLAAEAWSTDGRKRSIRFHLQEAFSVLRDGELL